MVTYKQHHESSAWPLLALTTASIRFTTVKQEVHKVSLQRLDHVFPMACFKMALLLCAVEHASLSRMDHTVKSMRLKSELEVGHVFLSQSLFKQILHLCCIAFYVWDGEPF